MSAAWGVSVIAALGVREALRLVRRPSQIVAVVGTPLMVCGVLAAGLHAAPPVAAAEPGGSYGAYLLPGAMLLVVLFGAAFGAMSLIEDRRDGLWRLVEHSPVSPLTAALGKVLPLAALSALQAIVLLPLAPALGLSPGLGGMLLGAAALGLMALGTGGWGLALAQRIDSPRGFHGVINLAVGPGWLLSGAVFPMQAAAPWLTALQRLNPFGWTHRALAAALGTPGVQVTALEWLGVAAFAGLGLAAALVSLGRRGVPHD